MNGALRGQPESAWAESGREFRGDSVSEPRRPCGLGRVAAVQYNRSFLVAVSIFSYEGVAILPVKPNLKPNYVPHQNLRPAQGSSPVKSKHAFVCRAIGGSTRMARMLDEPQSTPIIAASLTSAPKMTFVHCDAASLCPQ